MQNKEYVNIMADSLSKKRELLETLLKKTQIQAELISGKEYEDINWDHFNVLIGEKDLAINNIEVLDDGFEQVFNRMKTEIDANKSLYVSEIKSMQENIKAITDLGVAIQAAEDRNRREIERIMTKSKKEIKNAKKSLKVSTSYFNSMYKNGGMAPEPSQIDENK